MAAGGGGDTVLGRSVRSRTVFSPYGPGNRLTPLFAVVTLLLGILTFVFSGMQAAIAVFVVGWLLLVPASMVPAGPP